MALLERLLARAEAAAEQQRRRVEAAWAAVPGIKISREEDRLVITGRGLVTRWLGDVRLRFATWGASTSSAGPPPRAGEDLR